MAAAFMRQLAGNQIEVLSAGSEPADQVDPGAVRAMAEVGIDIAAATLSVLTPDSVQDSDVVITMGCGDACPYFPLATAQAAGRGVRRTLRRHRQIDLVFGHWSVTTIARLLCRPR